MNNDTLEDVTDECRGLLADKEMLMTHVATAHTHLTNYWVWKNYASVRISKQ